MMAARYATSADLPAEFDETDSATVALWLDVAEQRLGLAHWGDRLSQAHTLLTAHMLKQAGEGSSGSTGSSGPVKRHKVGDVEIEWASAPSTGAGANAGTVYGDAFEALRKTLPRTPVVG